MAVNENDLELLHAYLDGELPTAECEGLWRRLASERELQAELDQLRADCSIRAMAWNSLEPDERSVIGVEANLMRAIRREDIMGWVFNGLRIVASAAALIIFGFTIGWLGRDRMYATPIASLNPAERHSSAAGSVPLPAEWNVEMRDNAGKIVKVFEFKSEDEARQFIRDWAAHASPSNTGDSSAVPTPDKF